MELPDQMIELDVTLDRDRAKAQIHEVEEVGRATGGEG
jgi:hypothetical protein